MQESLKKQGLKFKDIPEPYRGLTVLQESLRKQGLKPLNSFGNTFLLFWVAGESKKTRIEIVHSPQLQLYQRMLQNSLRK